MLSRVGSGQGIVGCAMSLKPPPPGLSTSCSERLLSVGSSRGVQTLLPSPPGLRPLAQRRPRRFKSRATRLTGNKRRAPAALEPREPGAPLHAGRRPGPPDRRPPQGPCVLYVQARHLGSYSLGPISPGPIPPGPPLAPPAPLLGAPGEDRSPLPVTLAPAPAVKAPK